MTDDFDVADTIRQVHVIYDAWQEYCTVCEEDWPCSSIAAVNEIDRLRSIVRWVNHDDLELLRGMTTDDAAPEIIETIKRALEADRG